MMYQSFKEKAQEKFKQCITKLMNKQYEFYVMEPRKGYSLQQVIENNFKLLCGKVFRPYDDRDILILALQNKAAENKKVLELIDTYFVRYDYSIGEDVNNAIHADSDIRS